MTVQTRSSRELASLIAALPDALVAIDGFQGAGKSALATEIAATLGMRCVHLDDFLLSGRAGFVEFLKYPELSNALANRPVLVEGVCLLEVLERLALRPDMLVYVDSAIPEKNTARGRGQVACEIMSYHKRFQPISVADVIYGGRESAQRSQSMGANEAEIDIAFIRAKTKLSITLAIGGMVALLVGLIVLLHGVTGSDQALVTLGNFQISASGIGGVIMITSVLWAFAAYQARPIYSRTRRSSQKFDADQRLLEREDVETATLAKARQEGIIGRLLEGEDHEPHSISKTDPPSTGGGGKRQSAGSRSRSAGGSPARGGT